MIIDSDYLRDFEPGAAAVIHQAHRAGLEYVVFRRGPPHELLGVSANAEGAHRLLNEWSGAALYRIDAFGDWTEDPSVELARARAALLLPVGPLSDVARRSIADQIEGGGYPRTD